MELIETSIFTRQILALLDDEAYAKFQATWRSIQSPVLSSGAAQAFGKFAWPRDLMGNAAVRASSTTGRSDTARFCSCSRMARTS